MFVKIKKSWPAKRVDVAMIGVILLAFLIFFAWVIFRQRLLLGGDAYFYSYPLRSVAWSSIRNGELPLWTPLILSGYPLLSMAQLALGYPITWAYLFLPGYIAEQIYVFAPFLLAPSFTYAYARSIGRSPLASLLAGLSFGYGGAMTGLLGVVGLFGNSFMWLPLLLIAVDRSRTKRFLPSLLAATAAFALSVLNGLAQAFVFIAFLSLAYAAWLSCQPGTGNLTNRLRPLLLVVLAALFGSGIAAFQIFETLLAAQLSIRSSLNFITFADGSFSPAVALRSFLAPLYTERFADVTTFVSPLAFALALVAGIKAWRTHRSDDSWRIRFWSLLAIAAALLILGSYTPVARLVFHIPVLNKFRVPSRHAFEWTFAISILAAYGWDEIKLNWSSRLSNKSWLPVFALCLLVVTATTGYVWFRATINAQTMAGVEAVGSWYAGLSITKYMFWKTVWLFFGLLCIAVVGQIPQKKFQMACMITLVGVACLTEPYILFRNWWSNLAKTTARVQTPTPVTRALKANDGNRIYTRFDLFVDDTAASPRVDSPDLTALYGLQNVGGYEPLMFERYSRALGNVGLDSVNARPGYPAPDILYSENSHILDILNTTTVTAFTNLRTTPRPLPVFEGVQIALNETGLELLPRSTKLIGLSDFNADGLMLVTSMANSVDVEQGTPVARLRLWTDNGNQIEKLLRAGIDTAEWAYERPDVRLLIKHQQARVFDRQFADLENSYQACRYVTRIALDNPQRIKRVEMENLTPRATIALWAASLFNSSTNDSQSLSRLMLTVQNNPLRWQIEKLNNDVLLLHNSRALPRAWLVSDAEAVEGEEALKRLRDESAERFDPRRTVLLEVAKSELPALSGEALTDSDARITEYRNNRLRIETSASTGTVLVVSEIFYPGWEATIDGEHTKLLLADYLLRAVAVPAGTHVIEMRYTAPGARNGAIVSVVSLVIFIGLFGRWLRLRREFTRPHTPPSSVLVSAQKFPARSSKQLRMDHARKTRRRHVASGKSRHKSG